MTDEQLLRGLKTRQQDAMAALMNKYHRYVYAVVKNVLGSAGGPEDVEELVQDAFYAVWTHAEAIGDKKLRAYLGTTARNKAKSWLRGRKEIPMALDTIEIPDPGGGLDDIAQQEELCRMVRRAVDGMPPRDREIFLRHYFYFQTAEEIAARMGMNQKTVLSRLFRGRKRLEKSLQKEVLT